MSWRRTTLLLCPHGGLQGQALFQNSVCCINRRMPDMGLILPRCLMLLSSVVIPLQGTVTSVAGINTVATVGGVSWEYCGGFGWKRRAVGRGLIKGNQGTIGRPFLFFFSLFSLCLFFLSLPLRSVWVVVRCKAAPCNPSGTNICRYQGNWRNRRPSRVRQVDHTS